METFGLITLYSILVLTGLSLLSATFVFLGVWITGQVDEDSSH